MLFSLFDQLDVERALSPDRAMHRHMLRQDPEDVEGAEGGNLAVEGKALEISAWQDQCFLLDGHKVILDKALGAHPRPPRWTNLISVDIQESPGTLISKLTGNSTEQSGFFKLRPEQLSALIPKMRLFLMRYKTDPPITAATTGSVDLTFDKATEIYFDAHTKERTVLNVMKKGQGRAYGAGLKSFEYEFDGKDPATSEKSIKARLEILLTSFDQLTEVQPNGARMIDLLLRAPQMIPRYDVQAAQKASNVLDFCRAPKTVRDIERKGSELVFNPKFRRIKAVVGWAVPPSDMPGLDSQSKLFTTAQRQMIEDAQLSLFLEMTDYNLDFNNNGTVKLSIDYRASVEGALLSNQADIFFVLKQQIKTQQLRTDRKIKKLKELAKARIDRVNVSAEGPDPNKPPPKETQREKKIKAINEKLKEEIKNEKAYANLIMTSTRNNYYRYFLESIITKDQLFKLEIHNKYLRAYRGLAMDRSNASPEERELEVGKKERSNQAYAEARENKGYSSIYGHVTASIAAWENRSWNENTGPNPHQVVRDNEKTDIDCELQRLYHDQRTAQRKWEQSTSQPTPWRPFQPADPSQQSVVGECNVQHYENHRKIFFMLMGDVLNAAMYFVNYRNSGVYTEELGYDGHGVSVKAGKMGTNVRLVTTNIDFSGIDDLAKTHKPGFVNIADIPVSLAEFSNWFRRNVIDKKLTSYYVGDFIKDIMEDLFFRALGDACYAGRGQPIPQLTTTIVDTRKRNSPYKNRNIDEATSREAIPRTAHVLRETSTPQPGGVKVNGATHPEGDWLYERIYNKSLLNKFVNFRVRPNTVDPEKIVHYYILHGATRTVLNRVANKQRDEKQGIYHLGIGHDRGIVQKINFAGTELKYAAEARTQFDGQVGLGQLFQKFDATIDLYGCPLFRNGQYLYLDPKTLGNDLKVAQAIGMGGYYHVYNVIGEITPGGYTTKLKCNFNSNGLCPDTNVQAAQKASTTVAGATGSAPTNTPAPPATVTTAPGGGTLCDLTRGPAEDRICANEQLSDDEKEELIAYRRTLDKADQARFDQCLAHADGTMAVAGVHPLVALPFNAYKHLLNEGKNPPLLPLIRGCIATKKTLSKLNPFSSE